MHTTPIPMKFTNNIFFILCLLLLCVYTVHANEQAIATSPKKELPSKVVLNQRTDSIQAVKTQQELIAVLTKKQEAFEMRYYLLAGFTLFLVLLFGVLCFFNKKGDKRLEKIMSLLEKSRLQKNSEEKNSDAYIDIDEAVVATILENLQAFEKERGFLVSKITLHEFAKNIKTNTKYLSKVINTYKLKTFRNYINDLRIQYSITELQTNTDYRKYTVKAMAQEVGFSTSESFSKAFQKKTGNTVSSFLKNIHEQ